MDDFPITIGGAAVADPCDRLRRYCGLPWSGGPPETWAYRYYDLVPTTPDDVIGPVDVLAAGVIHTGLTRADLAFFADNANRLADWLAPLPHDLQLDDAVLQHLATLTDLASPVSLSLLTKVLHRKRPKLLPIVDRAIVDRYLPTTGEPTAEQAWRPLLHALHDELGPHATGETRLLLAIAAVSATDGTHELSLLRALDIIVWMEGRA